MPFPIPVPIANTIPNTIPISNTIPNTIPISILTILNQFIINKIKQSIQ